ncbi:MAG: 30S ribosomal protein S4 [Candidatus Sericytochromatia bacterium]
MARYTGPKVRQYRALGIAEFSGKKAGIKRPYRPGMHGQARQKLSEYAIRLKEKQKVRVIYGVLEKQFRRYYAEAVRQRGVTGEILLQLLERRLDNTIFRLGLARSRPQARQFVNHGMFMVDGQRVDICSFRVKPGMVIKVHPKKEKFFKEHIGLTPNYRTPSWLEFDAEKLEAKVVSLPAREENDIPVNEAYIVEYYSR